MFKPRCSPWFLTLAVFSACSDDPVTQPPVNNNKDATVGNPDAIVGNTDAGPNGMDATAGNPDATAGNPDAMVTPGVCDPITGGGCNMGETCYYVPGPGGMAGDLVCRIAMPVGMPGGAHEAACNLGMQDCAAGFHCVAFQGIGTGMPQCFKGCSQNTDCNGLTGAGMDGYACTIRTQDMKASFCQARAAGCVPSNPQSCPMGQTCDLGPAGPGCVGAGVGGKGAVCTAGMPNQCQRGLACLNFGMGGTCREMCDPAAPMCSTMGEGCAEFGIMGSTDRFGACEPGCDVYAQMCPNAGNCTAISQTAVGCVPSGMAAIGAECGQNNPCVQGGHCLNLGMGLRCFAACDATHACATGMCAMTNPPLPWGGICN